MKYNHVFIVLVILFFGSSCSYKKSKTNEFIEPSKYTWAVIDSFIVKEVGDLTILDYDSIKSEFLAVNQSTANILRIDTNGRILMKFDPVKKNDKLSTYVYGVGKENNSIAVLTNFGLCYYSLDGKKLLDFSNNKITYSNGKYRLRYISNHGDSLLICVAKLLSDKNELNNTANPDYYSHSKNLLTFNTIKKSFIEVIPYERKSIYRRSDRNYLENHPYFEINKDSLLNIVYDSDTLLYQYSFEKNKFNLKGMISIKKDYGENAIGKEYDFRGTVDLFEGLKAMALETTYRNIFIKNDTTYLVYNTGVPKEELKDVETMSKLQEIWQKNLKQYIQVLVNGQKISTDTSIPTQSSNIECIYKNNFLLNKMYNKNGESVFYISKLVQK